jgi:hypothetical protein
VFAYFTSLRSKYFLVLFVVEHLQCFTHKPGRIIVLYSLIFMFWKVDTMKQFMNSIIIRSIARICSSPNFIMNIITSVLKHSGVSYYMYLVLALSSKCFIPACRRIFYYIVWSLCINFILQLPIIQTVPDGPVIMKSECSLLPATDSVQK